MPGTGRIILGDVLHPATWESIPDGSIQCCVTSPPYWGLRDYGVDGQLGLEKTPDEFIARMVQVFRYVRAKLRDDGCIWVNMGDSYATQRNDHVGGGFGDNTISEHSQVAKRGKHCPPGLKMKDLCGIPWRLALALRADGWYLRQDIIWHKPAPMPESVTDRCTKAHEYIFLLAKNARYFYDAEAIKENVGQIVTRSATSNEKLAARTAAGSALCASTSDKKGFGRDITTNGRNARSVWTINTSPFSEAHFATFPPRASPPVHRGWNERARMLPGVRRAVGEGNGTRQGRQDEPAGVQ